MSGVRRRPAALLGVSLGVSLVVGLALAAGCAAPASWDAGLDHLPRVDVLLGGSTDDDAVLVVTALVADTAQARSRGLQAVTDLPSDAGMLFVFPGRARVAEDRAGFWMLDTPIPLDIAFAADGVVVGVATMLPCVAAPCPITHPGVPYDAALEVSAGLLSDAGVGPGARFAWRATSDSAGGSG